MEIWKAINGYEGLYEVSNLGNVRSLDRLVNNNGGLDFRRGKILQPNYCRGYRLVCLCKDGKVRKKRIARLVANAFIPNTHNKEEVDHINTIKDDDRVENLRWVNKSENMCNPLTKEHLRKNKSKRVLMLDYNGEITFFDSALQASEILGISRDTIYRSFKNGAVLNNQVKFLRV